MRNSANPTMLDAGYKVNVIPGHAAAYVDGRVLPGGEDEFRDDPGPAHRRPTSTWEFHHREVPLAGAGRRAHVRRDARRASSEFDPGGHVVPYCMSGGTDAKQFSRLGITGYGFSPLQLPEGFDYRRSSTASTSGCRSTALHFGVRVLDRFLRTA